MATIYRIEHRETRLGMYRNQGYKGISDSPNYNEDSDGRHPHPLADTPIKNELERLGFDPWIVPKKYSYGFSSVEQLRSWIPDDKVLKDLDSYGYILAIVESDDVIMGHSQAMFIKPDKYKRKSIKKFFNL